MKCTACGVGNARSAKFCIGCGVALREAKKREAPRSGLKHRGILALLAVVTVAVGLVAVSSPEFGGSERPSAVGPAPQPFDDPVRQVASKFLCSCGNCEVLELADCTCPTAIEEKALIAQELKRGTPEARVINLVTERYGHLKPRYASALGTGGGESAASGTAEPIGLDQAVADQMRTPGVAVPGDTLAITSRFTCACGQCQEDALSECDCSHPRGAVEMKAFIAYLISQQRHTTEQIVEAVSYEYGHLVADAEPAMSTGGG